MSTRKDTTGSRRDLIYRSSRFGLWIAVASYFSQGLVYGVLTIILIPTLAQKGVSLEQQVGIVGSALVAWSFKSIWAPFLDRFFRRLPPHPLNLINLIAVIQFVLAGAFLVIADLSEIHPPPLRLAYLWFLVNILVSIQDSATDAWIIDSIPSHQHGRVSAWLMTGRQLGFAVLTAFGLGYIASSHGLSRCVAVAAAIMFSVGLWMFVVSVLCSRQLASSQTVPSQASPLTTLKELWNHLGTFFRNKPLRQGLLVAFVAWLPNGAISGASPNFLFQRAQWTISDYQAQIVPSAAICGTLAFFCSTWIVKKTGIHRLMIMGSSTLGLTWIALGFLEPWWTWPATLLIFVWFEATATSLFMVGIYAWYMGLVSSKVRATQFVLLMSALNLSEYFGVTLSPKMFAALDYQGLWWVCGVLQLTISGYLFHIWKQCSERNMSTSSAS